MYSPLLLTRLRIITLFFLIHPLLPGIVHRDLKPQNIVFPTKGNMEDVKIIDFGMSKRGMKRTMFGRRAVQTACGTPLYVAPELVEGARYDEKIDIWAIGVLAYQMASGRHPFQGKDQDETLEVRKNILFFFFSSAFLFCFYIVRE